MIKKYDKKICIFGAGGSGRDTLCCLIDSIQNTDLKIQDIACFMVGDDYFFKNNLMGIDVIPQSKFNPSFYDVVVSIGDPILRKKAVDSLPSNTTFTTIIHPSVILSKWVEIGEGSIISAGSILTCNIKVGRHCNLNLQTTITHDCQIGDFFTTAPGVKISGNCQIGDYVYFGTNSSVREKIKICSNVTIGMGGIVVKDINESGIYVGNPVKKLNRK